MEFRIFPVHLEVVVHIMPLYQKARESVENCFLKRRAKRGALLFAFGFFSPKRDIPQH